MKFLFVLVGLIVVCAVSGTITMTMSLRNLKSHSLVGIDQSDQLYQRDKGLLRLGQILFVFGFCFLILLIVEATRITE